MLQQKPRDVKFDGLRVIGLLAIILAHVNPPALLFQLRNFDVPLMVLVSGAVYGLSSGSSKKYISYIWGRVQRLLFPTWVFLCMFFLLNFIFGKSFSQSTILESFALFNGIGYVWIIRVFILVALIAPFFVYLYQKIQNKTLYLLAVFLVYLFYSLLYHVYLKVPFLHTNASIDFVFQNIIFYMLPFGAVAGLGIYLLKASKKSVWLLLAFFAGVFAVLAYKYAHPYFVPTQAYKYPPGIYYLAYALAASLVLYLLSFTKMFQKIFGTRFMQFVSSASLWIYLWQIFFLYQWSSWQVSLPKPLNNFFIEYVVVFSCSVVVTYLQRLLVKKIITKLPGKTLQTLLSISFLK